MTSPEAAFVTPALTTVRQPLHQMGSAAVRLLIGLMEDSTRPATRVTLETALIVRESTAPPARP